MPKNNAIRILESKGISFQTCDYEASDDDLSGESVAYKIDADPDLVFKTLVGRDDKSGLVVFCIPVTAELDLKKAATASGNKKVEMIKQKELLPQTGYVCGGCTPIGMKKLFPTYIDETAQLCEKIYFSAGVRGTQVFMSPEDLKHVVDGEYADLI